MVQEIVGDVKWVPVSTVVRALRVSRQRVYAMIGSGRLQAQVSGSTWLVSLRSLNEVIALRAKEGR